MSFGRVMGIWYNGIGALCNPLMRTCRAFCQFPFIAEQIPEEIGAPLCRGGRPSDFQTARNGVAALACTVTAFPPQTLLFKISGFRLVTNKCRIACTMGFTKGVAAGNECHSFFVVHGHTFKGFADIMSSCQWIRIAVRT